MTKMGREEYLQNIVLKDFWHAGLLGAYLSSVLLIHMHLREGKHTWIFQTWEEILEVQLMTHSIEFTQI